MSNSKYIDVRHHLIREMMQKRHFYVFHVGSELLLLVIMFSRLIFNPACGQLNRETNIFPCPRSSLRIWSRETGSAVPSRVSPLILHAQAESGAYSRAPLFPPRFPPRCGIDTGKAPSGESLAKTAFQWRHHLESAGTGPLVPW